MMPFLGKSARENSKQSAPKSHLKAKLWNNDFVIKVGLKKKNCSITSLDNYASRFRFIESAKIA